MSGSAGASGEQSPEATQPTVGSEIMNVGYVRVLKEQDLDLQMWAFQKPVARGSFRGSLERYGLPKWVAAMLSERRGGPSHAKPCS